MRRQSRAIPCGAVIAAVAALLVTGCSPVNFFRSLRAHSAPAATPATLHIPDHAHPGHTITRYRVVAPSAGAEVYTKPLASAAMHGTQKLTGAIVVACATGGYLKLVGGPHNGKWISVRAVNVGGLRIARCR